MSFRTTAACVAPHRSTYFGVPAAVCPTWVRPTHFFLPAWKKIVPVPRARLPLPVRDLLRLTAGLPGAGGLTPGTGPLRCGWVPGHSQVYRRGAGRVNDKG